MSKALGRVRIRESGECAIDERPSYCCDVRRGSRDLGFGVTVVVGSRFDVLPVRGSR